MPLPAADNGAFWTNAAFLAAALTATAGLVSLAWSKIYEQQVRRSDFRDGRRAAIVRFTMDVTLRRKDLVSNKEAYNDPRYKRHIVDLINAHARDGKPFRLFGVQVSDTKVQDEIATYLATFPRRSQELISEAILRDRQMVALYLMNTTEAFERLSPERQAEAFERWLQSANDLITSLDALAADRSNWAPQPDVWIHKLVRMSKGG